MQCRQFKNCCRITCEFLHKPFWDPFAERIKHAHELCWDDTNGCTKQYCYYKHNNPKKVPTPTLAEINFPLQPNTITNILEIYLNKHSFYRFSNYLEVAYKYSLPKIYYRNGKGTIVFAKKKEAKDTKLLFNGEFRIEFIKLNEPKEFKKPEILLMENFKEIILKKRNGTFSMSTKVWKLSEEFIVKNIPNETVVLFVFGSNFQEFVGEDLNSRHHQRNLILKRDYEKELIEIYREIDQNHFLKMTSNKFLVDIKKYLFQKKFQLKLFLIGEEIKENQQIKDLKKEWILNKLPIAIFKFFPLSVKRNFRKIVTKEEMEQEEEKKKKRRTRKIAKSK